MTETISIAGKRFYNINGEFYPSITTIISMLPKPALERWKARLGEDKVRLISKYTSQRGELIHYFALKHYENETVSQEVIKREDFAFCRKYPKMRGELEIALEQFKKFTQKYHLKAIDIERCVYSNKYQIAGRVDFVGYLVNEKTDIRTSIIMDIKTSKQIYYDSLALQLAGYNICLKRKFEKCFVLVLHPGRTKIADEFIGCYKPFFKFKEIIPNYNGFRELVSAFQPLKKQLLNKSLFKNDRNR